MPGYVRRVLRYAGRVGLVAAVATFAVYAVAHELDGVSLDEARTAATMALLAIGLWNLGILARPFTRWRVILLGAMAGAFALTVAIPGVRHFFALAIPPAKLAVVIVVAVGVAALVLEMSRRVFATDY